MTKSLRMIEENLKLVDAVIYVLDARAPQSSLNPSFDRLIADKKIIYVLNKSDISDSAVNKLWQKYFSQKNSCLSVCGTNKGLTGMIIKELNSVLSDKILKYKQKGVNMPIRAMVIGVPNSGKSTIINTLCGNKRAQTGDKPGVTRGKQWVRLDRGIELLDTPGTLWNSFDDQNTGRHLAYIGSIKEDVLDAVELAICLLDELKEMYAEKLNERYGIFAAGKPANELLFEICKNRGYLLKGCPDTERCAKAVLDDFRKARIGKISLERP